MDKLWILPVFLLDYLPFTYFLFVSLRDDIIYKSKKVGATVFFLCTLAISIFFFLPCLHPAFDYDNLRLLRLGCMITMYVLTVLSVKKATAKATFVFFLITPFPLGISFLAAYISHLIRGDTPPYMVSSIIRFAITVAAYPFMIWLWGKIGKEVKKLKGSDIWKYLWIIPTSVAVSEVLLFDRNFEFSPPSLSGIIGRLVLCICSAAICWLLFFMANRFELRIHLEDTKQRNEMLLELQKQQYIDLADSIDRARAARHDLRHHLNAIESLLNKGEYDKLKDYVAEMVGTLPTDNRIKICENYAANAVMDHYIRKANELEVPIKVSFHLGNQVGMSDGDLCVLLGNTVENAIEAASKLPPEKRFVSVNATEEAGRIYMTFDNSFDGTFKKIEGNYLSRKRDFSEIGVGIASVNAIVKKYGGDMKIEISDNVFKLSIMLCK